MLGMNDDHLLQSCQSGGTTEGRGLEDTGKPCFLLKGLTKGSGILQPGPAPQSRLPHAAHQQVACSSLNPSPVCFVMLLFSGTPQSCCYRTSLFCASHSGPAHKHMVLYDRHDDQLSHCRFAQSKTASCSYSMLVFAGLQL